MPAFRNHMHAVVTFLILAFAVAGAILAESPLPAGEPLAIGLEKQLLVDDYLLAEMSNADFELGTVTKANEGRPIFTEGWFYGTVLHDEGRFKMWFRRPENQGYGYAESDDGIAFVPRAHVTGINFAGDYTMSVLVDPHETDAAHRYKAAYDGPGMAAALAHSADGIRWTPYNQGRAVTGRAADTYNQVLWDEGAQTYRLFTRTDFGTAGGSGEVRGNRGMTNADIKSDPTRWHTVREWIFDRDGADEPQRRQIYALTDSILHNIHFALMSVYEWPGDVSEGPADLEARHERDIMNFYIATSRDGDQWNLRWVYAQQPLVPRGPDGSFDKDIVFPSSAIVTHQDRHWIYYAGANERHGTPEVAFPRRHAIGLATLRLDGFVGVAAKNEPASITTRSFRLDGGKLALNVDAREGYLLVEVLDEAGAPIPGFTRHQATRYSNIDELSLRPAWNHHTDLAPLVGKIVRLRFELQNARLYALQVER